MKNFPKLISKTLGLKRSSKKRKAAKHHPNQTQEQFLTQNSNPGPLNQLLSEPSTLPCRQAQSIPPDETVFKKRVVPEPTHKKSKISYMFSRCKVRTSDSGDNLTHRRKFWGVLEGHDAKRQYDFVLAECEEAISDTEAHNCGSTDGNMNESIDYTKRETRRKIRKLNGGSF